MLKRGLLLLVAFQISFMALSQEDTTDRLHYHRPHYHSLSDYIRAGNFTGDTRTFFMSTINQGELRDDYALATGAGIGYRSAAWKGLGFGMNGFFIFNVFSNPLERPDRITGAANRYEVGLFDLTNPTNRNDLGRLEEAYIYYTHKKINVKLGRQVISTPLINEQDGRMRPSLAEGIWASGKILPYLSAEGGWLWAFSPRSTVEWYYGAKSIGAYPTGTSVLGKKTGYHKNTLQSKGVGVVNLTFEQKQTKVALWSYYVQNIMHNALVQVEQDIFSNEHQKLRLFGQYLHQQVVGNGGHTEIEKRYVQPNHMAQVFSGRIAFKHKKWTYRLNVTHITKDGRYEFPREWGRDPFYTFIRRERHEGLGNMNAITSNVIYEPNSQTQIRYDIGYVQTPDTKDFRFNKNGLPDYVQQNLEVKYTMSGVLEGLSFTGLIMTKLGTEQDVPLANTVNRINLLHFSLMADYHFSNKETHEKHPDHPFK
jgi:hypothetical protein